MSDIAAYDPGRRGFNELFRSFLPEWVILKCLNVSRQMQKCCIFFPFAFSTDVISLYGGSNSAVGIMMKTKWRLR
jgi:hypothetical protein